MWTCFLINKNRVSVLTWPNVNCNMDDANMATYFKFQFKVDVEWKKLSSVNFSEMMCECGKIVT